MANPTAAAATERADLAELAERAARDAGEALMRRFRRPAEGLTTKASPTDLVSEADREADRIIQRVIGAARPHDRFLTEESGAVDAAGGAGDAQASVVRWVVDPLDGTVNYLYGIPHFAVSIAAEVDGEVVAGVVHNPAGGELYRAVRGAGATLNGEPIRCSACATLGEALVGTGFYYTPEVRRAQAAFVSELVVRARDVRRAGAAALDLAAVACGRLDAYVEAPHGGWWDAAAGALLVVEAGGVARPFEPPWAEVPGALAAAPGVARALENCVAELLA